MPLLAVWINGHHHMSNISEYTTDINHIMSKNNEVDDALSGVQLIEIAYPSMDTINYEVMADPHALACYYIISA